MRCSPAIPVPLVPRSSWMKESGEPWIVPRGSRRIALDRAGVVASTIPSLSRAETLYATWL
jgi:hypothetical protein